MRHRFSVELAVVATVSVIGAGYLASSMQPASALSSGVSSVRTEVSEVAEDTIARTYTRPRGRGTGRRGVLD
jgi:hypothetical protein